VEHFCSQESGGATSDCENKISRQHSKQPPQKGSRAGKMTRPTGVLSKDDQLLIELKEERSLPWKRIAEYFPGRSESSLQVRYSTRLKGRKAGNSRHSERRSNARSESSYRGTPCEAVQASVARAKAPKVCQDGDTVHLGAGKRWIAIPRFELAIVISLCRISAKRIAKNKNHPAVPSTRSSLGNS
jgi:hypothetical protein